MRKFFMILFSTAAITSRAQISPALSLMPVPKYIAMETGKYKLSSGFTISVHADPTDTVLYRAVDRMFQTLNRRTGLLFIQGNIRSKEQLDSASMIVLVKQKSKVLIGADESYHIKILEKQIWLQADNTIGALHGMETILQLLSIDEGGYYFPALRLDDAPRFAWRGLMIDVARHFIPVDNLKRNIDAMAAVKMNVLHLHLSDDQGFRVESKIFPKLQGAGSGGEFYSQYEIRELIGYGEERGILIVPEFDMPGHASSWFAGYPELATQPGSYTPGWPLKIDRSHPAGPMELMKLVQTAPLPTMSPTKETVYGFLDRFIAEMTALFPSPYFHMGADENNGVTWKQDSVVVAFMKKNNFANPHELQAYFVNRVHQLITHYGKKTIGWEELFSKNLPQDITVQVWSVQAPPNLAQQIRAQGNQVILSKGLYLDYFLPAYIHYKIEFPSEDILGGEAAQWTELADADNLETRIWPRAAAIAERFWSPKTVRDSADMYRRLFIESDRLAESGLLQMAHYDKMVLRLSTGFNYQATRTLMDVLTPVKGYKRLFGFFNQPEAATYPHAPLVRPTDIAMIDPREKWEFRNNVADYLSTRSAVSERAIRDQLIIWSVNDDQLQPLFKSSSLAREVAPHSKNLSALSVAGIEALDMIKQGKQPDARWLQDKQALLHAAQASYGEVELSVLPELTALLTGQLAPLPNGFPLL